MVCVPAPAVVGLKTPVLETPAPNHVPPVVAAVRFIGASLEHKLPGSIIAASGLILYKIYGISLKSFHVGIIASLNGTPAFIAVDKIVDQRSGVVVQFASPSHSPS